MKNIKLALLVLLAATKTSFVTAQPVLEHTYNTGNMQTVLLSAGMKYYFHDRNAMKFTFYNEDHTLYKEVDLSTFLPVGYSNYYVEHISDKLINTDSKIEFLIEFSYPFYTHIYINEDGVEVFDFDLLSNYQDPTLRFEISFIKTAHNIYKMIVSYQDHADINQNWTKVYSLPGNLPEITSTIAPYAPLDLKAFPNPASAYTRIAYELPTNFNKGQIRFFDTKGRFISEYEIGKDFNDILINTSGYQEGIYVYQLWANNELKGTDKLVVLK